ncbi:hypothetical protein Acr_15g0006610 [Actinidia rufa]|uniref:Uncharacterized protein n=1 Tax=Actinidia rufa TaxID=165716 RepID=A0A7J0FTM3_9ERIC|nr:hypothetical protein Acr_15g0006610 [Actinidia rufa]
MIRRSLSKSYHVLEGIAYRVPVPVPRTASIRDPGNPGLKSMNKLLVHHTIRQRLTGVEAQPRVWWLRRLLVAARVARGCWWLRRLLVDG